MRYSETHKAETREHVLEVAAQALREKGPDHLAVAEVMKAAGLTHGGFYAHFESKEAFLADTLAAIFAQSAEKAKRIVGDLPPREALAAYIDFYVSESHRDRLSDGCPIVTLNSDLPRQSKAFRAVFDAGLQRLTARVADWIAAIGLQHPDKLAASVVSAMAGAVALSRAISDPQASNDLLAAARDGIKAQLGLTDAAISLQERT